MITKIGTSHNWDYKYTDVESEDKNEVLDESTIIVVEKSNYTQEYITTAIATIGMFLVGLHFAWIVPILPTLLSGTFKIHITIEQSVWVISLVSVGAIPGSIIGSMVSNSFGRKNAILLISIPYCVSSVIFIIASDVWHYYVARFMAGLGCGASCAVLPMYLSEIASAEIRGLLSTSLIKSLMFGNVIAYILGAYLPIATFAIICAIFPIMMFVLSFYLPETPYYHVMKQDLNLVEKSLKFLRKKENVRNELERLIEGYKEDNAQGKQTFWDLFRLNFNRKSLLIVFVLFMAQQLTGGTAVLSYSIVILNDGHSSVSLKSCGIFLALTNFAIVIISGSLVDKLGRRKLLSTTCIAQLIPLSALAVYFYLQNNTKVECIEYLRLTPLIAMVAFKLAYSIGILSVPSILVGELFSTSLKAQAASFAAVSGSLLGVVANKMYQMLYTRFDYPVMFSLFIVLNILVIIFIYFMVPETKGLTLEQIQVNLKKSEKPINMV